MDRSCENHSKCIIHTDTSKLKDEKLIKIRDIDSWKTLLEAAKIRKYEKIIKLAENLGEDEVPDVYYHRTCRSMFTMPRELQKLQQKRVKSKDENESSDEPPSKKSRSSRETATDSRVYVKECIFKKYCGNSKRIKGSSTREKLLQATQLRVDKKLRQIAIEKGQSLSFV